MHSFFYMQVHPEALHLRTKPTKFYNKMHLTMQRSVDNNCRNVHVRMPSSSENNTVRKVELLLKDYY